MANFTVNINSQSVENYVVTPSVIFPADMCQVPLVTQEPVGLIQSTATSSPIYYMLSAYTNFNIWKTLKIKNIVYSVPLSFYLSDTLVKIPEAGATVYDFDITGQLVDVAISNLNVTYDAYTPTGSATISFDLAIEDVNSEVGPYSAVTIFSSREKCDVPIFDLLIAPVAENSCTVSVDATVNIPPEGSRYVVVTSNDSYGSTSDTTAGITITATTVYSMIILASTIAGGIPTTYSTVAIEVYNDSGMGTLIASYQISRNHVGITC